MLTLHRRLRRAALALSMSLVLAGAHGADAIPSVVKDELARQGLPPGALAFQVLPLAEAAPRHARGEHQARNPASAMKLVTTLAALDALGPDHRWTTTLLADGSIEHGELKGNLVLRGGGEPNLGWERLGAMLRTLRAGGIHTLGGDLVLDRSLFQPARADLKAPPFDDTPDAAYNVIPDAVTVADYLVGYTLSSDGAAVAVRTTPPLAGVEVVNRLMLVDAPCAEWEDGWRRPQVERDAGGAVRIVLGGAFPRHCKAAIELSTLERDLYLERLVRALWQEMGGRWDGRVREGATPPGATMLVERQFETLGETIRAINKRSDGVKARLLFLTLGATATSGAGRPTLERASSRALDWVAAQGVDPAGIVIENGSGLSRAERVKPAQLSALLQAAGRSPWYPEFAASLPIAGRDGTLRKRLTDGAAAGKARLKTGTLRDVAALAGYVRDVRGRDWVVTAFVNDPQAAKGAPVLDRLMEWIAEGGAEQQVGP